MTPTIAYLASGKLFLKRDGSAAEPIESLFAQEMIEDAIRRREKNEWKTKSATGQLMAGATPWNQGQAEAETRRVQITGVARGSRPEELLYTLDTDLVGGLFVYDAKDRKERRLYHGNRFKARHLSRHPRQPLITFATHQEDGTSCIAVMNLETNDLHYVTEGDSLDEAPSWRHGPGARIVFQSAGLARNEQGALAGVGPYALQELDSDLGRLTTLREDERQDFLLPRPLEDGSLCFIRRRYQAHVQPSGLRVLVDVLLIPFRLIWALFGFLNFFAVMFSGKPLLTSGGPKREGPNPRHLMLWGRLVDAEKAEKRSGKGEATGLAPKDWELVRCAPDGSEAVLADGVVSYDLCSDGSLVFTNGSDVFHLDLEGRKHRLCEGKLIETVAVLA